MKYYVIYCDDDGDVHVHGLDKATLQSELDEGVYGGEFANSIPTTDPVYWGNQVLIIKGDIVVPTPATRTITYQIE